MRTVVFVPESCLPPLPGKPFPEKPGGEIAGPSRNRPRDGVIARMGNLTLNNPLGKHLRVFLSFRQAVILNGRNPYDVPVTATHRITAAPDAVLSDRGAPPGTPLPVSGHCLSLRLFIVVVHISSIIIDLPGYRPLPRRPSPVFPMPGGKRLRSLPGPDRTRDIYVRRADYY